MKEKGYYLVNFGCQMNEHDAEIICAMLEGLGYTAVQSAEEASLIIINTCAVRKKPEDKVASLLGKYKLIKKEKPGLFIAVGGCMTQLEKSAAYIKKRFPMVNLIFGTHALPRLPALLEQAKRSRKTVVDIKEDYADREGLPVKHASFFKAWLPVNYGCNNYCSYCIVPYARGRERSRSFAQIVQEAKDLALKGMVEVTLLGQNVNSYGHDLAEKRTFAELIYAINEIEGIKRIRFMTSHPKDLSKELIQAVKECSKACEHFHLPVQSGSNQVLEKMNRRYTKEHYLELTRLIKNKIPGVAITSDLIVGFPGESEEDFKETLHLVREARFDNIFSFIYSPRAGTRAATLKEQVAEEVKKERLLRLNEVQHAISAEINQPLEGRTLEVLAEGQGRGNAPTLTGRTRTNKLVHFPGPEELIGRLVEVKIKEAKTWHLTGELA